MKKAYKLASKIEMDKVKNESMRRQLLHVLRPGEAVLPDDKLDEVSNLEIIHNFYILLCIICCPIIVAKLHVLLGVLLFLVTIVRS